LTLIEASPSPRRARHGPVTAADNVAVLQKRWATVRGAPLP